MVEKGKFIVLEGIDGAGTTTQARFLTRYLKREYGADVLQTFEPSRSYVGIYIRQILGRHVLKDDGERYSDRAISALFLADRWLHIENEVLPAIEKGQHVISDRYYLSSFAYQRVKGRPLDELIAMHAGLPSPDLTLFLDISAEIGGARRAHRGGVQEIYEVDEFQRRVVEQYHAAIDKMKDKGDNIVMLDGTKSLRTVTRDVRAGVDSLLGN